MINVLINGARVSYETLDEAREAAEAGLGLAFWRETLEACAADSAVWNDFLNELWQSGGEREAEELDRLFADPDIRRRWTLQALVLQETADPVFVAAVKEASDGVFRRLAEWLQNRVASSADADVALVTSELAYWQQRQEQSEAAAKAEEERLRRERARYMVVDLSAGKTAEDAVAYLDDMPNGGWTDEYKTTKLVLRRIEPGTFMMGSPTNESGRSGGETQHRVTLTKAFYMGVFQVTQGQWECVMGTNPSDFSGVHRPVEEVSWDDCQRFCHRAGLDLRLSTEAEWEHACRAGTTGAYAGTLDSMAWYDSNSGSETHAVGQKSPNSWGLYDMHGNVWEWCADWYAAYGGDTTDPIGPASGEGRVIRGGGWYFGARLCRSAFRLRFGPGSRGSDLGFRVCCSVGSPECGSAAEN